MASYIVKSKGINLKDKDVNKITIGKFYSGDRFYTLLSEYIDKNLTRKSAFVAWWIKVLFRSSNFKHDPGIANGQPWSVRLFDWFCIICLIVFFSLTLAVIGTLIPIIMGLVGSGKISEDQLKSLKTAAMSVGFPAIAFGIPGVFWLIIYFAIRRKNKPLSLQAFVEKKISWCLKLRFLIKNNEFLYDEDEKEKVKNVFLLENFEAQGAASARWLNIQLINLVCSIFPDFNYAFRFESLSDDELKELIPIFEYDFKMIELVNADDIKLEGWKSKIKKSFFKK